MRYSSKSMVAVVPFRVKNFQLLPVVTTLSLVETGYDLRSLRI